METAAFQPQQVDLTLGLTSFHVMLRADMDALPIQEATGLPYASKAAATDREGNTAPAPSHVANRCRGADRRDPRLADGERPSIRRDIHPRHVCLSVREKAVPWRSFRLFSI